MKEVLDDHPWPSSFDHLWGPWQGQTGLPKPTEYRTCVHPDCAAVEYKDTPIV